MSDIFEPENIRVTLFCMVYIRAHQIVSFPNLPNVQKMPYNYFKFEGIGAMHFKSTIWEFYFIWRLQWYNLNHYISAEIDPVTKRRRDEQRGGWSWSCCIRTVFSLWVLPPVGFPSSLYSLLSPAHLLPLLCFLHNYFRIPHAQIFQIAVSSVGCQLPLFLLHILSKVIHLKTTLAETTLW